MAVAYCPIDSPSFWSQLLKTKAFVNLFVSLMQNASNLATIIFNLFLSSPLVKSMPSNISFHWIHPNDTQKQSCREPFITFLSPGNHCVVLLATVKCPWVVCHVSVVFEWFWSAVTQSWVSTVKPSCAADPGAGASVNSVQSSDIFVLFKQIPLLTPCFESRFNSRTALL